MHPPAGLIAKALTLLEAIAGDDGTQSIAAIAIQARIPQATAYRLVADLVDQGLLIAIARGRYMAGPRLIDLAAKSDLPRLLTRLARPAVEQLARRFRHDAHLAVMEGGMVTYLVKAGTGRAAAFARQGMQLEAYCSGVGKVLLAHLPDAELSDYLANGPFIRLTARTIVEPGTLRRHLDGVRAAGYALDDEEIAEGLKCVAVPLRDHRGSVVAALSLSCGAAWLTPARMAEVRPALVAASAALQRRLVGRRPNS